MSTEKNYKYVVGDRLMIEIEGFTQDNEGNPAYETSFGAIRESDLETLKPVEPIIKEVVKEVKSSSAEDNNVLLLVIRQNDMDYREQYFFDNWLDAYKEMFNFLIKDFTAEQVEEAMKSSQIKINQYSASVERDGGKYLYYIIKLNEDPVDTYEEDDGAEG